MAPSVQGTTTLQGRHPSNLGVMGSCHHTQGGDPPLSREDNSPTLVSGGGATAPRMQKTSPMGDNTQPGGQSEPPPQQEFRGLLPLHEGHLLNLGVGESRHQTQG